jgi:hypothetical protein
MVLSSPLEKAWSRPLFLPMVRHESVREVKPMQHCGIGRFCNINIDLTIKKALNPPYPIRTKLNRILIRLLPSFCRLSIVIDIYYVSRRLDVSRSRASGTWEK